MTKNQMLFEVSIYLSYTNRLKMLFYGLFHFKIKKNKDSKEVKKITVGKLLEGGN